LYRGDKERKEKKEGRGQRKREEEKDIYSKFSILRRSFLNIFIIKL